MAMTAGNRRKSCCEINVTPMIDVLLVLLIIFMVLFPPQSTGESADIPQPTTDPSSPPPGAAIVIRISQSGASQRPALKINDEEISWQSLGPRLQQIYALRRDKVAFLKGGPEVDFQYVAEAIDIAHHAGVARVGLMSIW